ncbi:MAG: diacylglycerol/lipid kinase family protein [Acidimicrobiia bacterium]
MTGERPERWTAVLNPAAGRGRGPARLARVRDALAVSGLDVTTHVSSSMEDLAAMARAAFDRGHGVIACGGDGTAGVVAGLAADHDGVLALVPTGSGNDLARHLALPHHDIAAAVDIVVRGDVAHVDLGEAETADGSTTWFTTVAGTGFDAEANRWANTQDRLTGTPLYVLAVLRTLRTYVPQPVRLTVDGEVLETEAWLVAVANTRTYAGGMLIAPAASMHDGLLDVCVVGPVSRAGFLRAFPGVFRGTHLRHPLITMQRGRDVTIELGNVPGRAGDRSVAAHLPELWASGERVGALPARLTARPGALRVVVAAARPAGDRLT